MITNYKNFISESLINESIIYYTPPVTTILELLSDDGNLIAKALLDVAGTDVKPDITFVDFSDKDGYLEFSTMKNAQKLIGDKYPEYLKGGVHDLAKVPNMSTIMHLYSSDARNTGVFDTSRNPIKIGRMINSIFPSRFNAKDVEEFVKQFKSRLDKMGERFELVEGDAIGEWYHYSKYKDTRGDLGNSCMCRKRSSFFDFYNDNPDVCKMLLLLDNEKLIGRALVWKTTDIYGYGETLEDVYFMDRQYTILDSDVEKFIRYAKEKNWAYKPHNNHYSIGTVIYNNQKFSGDMTVQMKHKHYDNFPYLDTFKMYDPETGILYNIGEGENNEDYNGRYILEDTDGGYNEVNNSVWSEWYNTDIDRDDAVWSDPLDDWILSEYAVRVERGSGADSYYPENHRDIVYVSSIDEYVHVDDCLWSEYDDEYVYEDDAINAIVGISDEGNIEDTSYFNRNSSSIYLLDIITKDDKDNDREWYAKLETNISEWGDARENGEAIYEDLVDLDYKRQYILSVFSIDTFIVKSDVEKTHFYLTREDAKLFGYELEKDDAHRKTDWFDYYKEIISYKDDVTLFRDKPFITIEDIYNKLKEDEDDSSNSKRIEFLEEYYYDYLPEEKE